MKTVDASDLQNTVWPRAAAVGEILWSDLTYTQQAAASSDGLSAVEDRYCTAYLQTSCDIIFSSVLIESFLLHSIPFPSLNNGILFRLETFRCLLTQRGIAAAPVTNTRARYAPKEPGSCYSQRRRL